MKFFVLMFLGAVVGITSNLFALDSVWRDSSGIEWSYTDDRQGRIVTGATEVSASGERVQPFGTLNIPKYIDNVVVRDVSGFNDYIFITKVVVPEGVHGVFGFSNCKELREVVIGEGVTMMGGFNNCPKLCDVMIPESLFFLKNEPYYTFFENCPSLPVFDGVQYESNRKRFFIRVTDDYPPVIKLPDSVTYIFPKVLSSLSDETLGGRLKEVILGENVLGIAPHAFFGCKSLERVYGSKKLKKIGSQAFAECDNLREVEVLECTEVDMIAFSHCTSQKLPVYDELQYEGPEQRIVVGSIRDESSQLYNRVVPNSVRVIAGDIWSNFNSNGEGMFVVSEGVQKIGSMTFDYLPFTSLYLPKSLKQIEGAFAQSRLQTVVFKGASFSLSGCEQLVNLFVNGPYDSGLVSSVENNPMWGMGGEEVPTFYVHEKDMRSWQESLPSSFKLKPWPSFELDGVRYEACGKHWSDFTMEIVSCDESKLPEHLVIPATIEWGEGSGHVSAYVVKIDDAVFKGIKKLKSVTFSGGNYGSHLWNIGQEAFADCVNLESIDMKNVGFIEWVGDAAFRNCVSLSTFYSPNKFHMLSDFMFSGCQLLKGIKLSSGLRRMGTSVFSGCSSLSLVELPETLSEIHRQTFDFYGGNIVFKGDVPRNTERSALGWRDNLTTSATYAAKWKAALSLSRFNNWPMPRPTIDVASEMATEQELRVRYRIDSMHQEELVYAVAFKDGIRSPEHLMRLTTGIGIPKGEKVACNTEQTFSWNISQDWTDGNGTVAIDVLVKRKHLLPMHHYMVPAYGNKSSKDIASAYVNEDDVFNAVVWQYLTGEQDLYIEGDSLLRKTEAGPIALIEGTHITSYALSYLYEVMGYRLLEGDQLNELKKFTRESYPASSLRRPAEQVNHNVAL